MRSEIALLPEDYAIVRRPPASPFPDWACGGRFVSVTRTTDELSIVCPGAGVPAGERASTGWRLMRLAGPLDPAMTGVLLGVIAPLAAAGVPVFTLATFDTDYLLVPAERLGVAVSALRAAGYDLRSAD